MSITYISNKDKYIETVTKKIIRTKKVLDIGCGIIPQPFINPKTHICWEPYKEYVDILAKRFSDNDDKIIINGTWEQAVNSLPDKSVDSIFLLDVVEHLPKREGLRLLKQTEKKARKQIIVFTPLGFMKQVHKDGKDAWGLSGAKWQEHKSGWNTGDFDKSWDVFVCKKYHVVDNLSKKFKKPFGAIYAIKTFDEKKDNILKSLLKIIFKNEN